MEPLPLDLPQELQAIYERQDGSDAEYRAESPLLLEALPKVLSALGDRYSLGQPIGRGGAGVVFQLYDNDLRIQRALKLPRPRQDELVESVRNEIDHLRSLRHEYLISVYAAGDVPVTGYTAPYPYFVMDFVEGAQELDVFLANRIATVAGARDVSDLTAWLARTLNTVSEALAFLHSRETLHFDIKPGNILIDREGKTVLSDLGFAKKKTNDPKPMVVGFTLFYAHPDLKTAYEHMSSQNRVRRHKAPSEFKYSWDLYALGRTMLQLLGLIDRAFPDAALYDYTFVYLHLMACRMLDGHNLAPDETDAIRDEQLRRGERVSVYHEHWLSLQRRQLAELRYGSASEVVSDFCKLHDPHYYLRKLPELSPYYPHRVQVSGGVAAPFSTRVKRLVEHPVFLRLRSVKQLGITDSVYPGCTHTRLEHSIGVFRMCTLYLQALENDPYNPLFLQLTDEGDLAALLVAALLHDLGQYPLAHELEDSASGGSLINGKRWKDIFRHETLSTSWLNNPTADAEGATIAEIIENAEWGWGIPVRVVAGLIDDEPSGQLPLLRATLKTRLLQSILNGPLDVDKLDYLVRDSRRAELPYGEMIDTDRLTRSLTVVLTKDEDGEAVLTLGTYEKGQSAGEAITFVRYQLYQALYWHHAVRAIRPMLREIIRQIPKDRTRAKQTIDEVFYNLLGVNGQPIQVSVDDVLGFLERATSPEGKELVGMIRQRRLYKRLLTIHSAPNDEGKEDLLQRFRTALQDPDFDSRLQTALRERFDQYLVGVAGPQPSALAPEKLNAIQEELLKPGRILCDCPSPRTGSAERLRLALEPKRRLQNYASRAEVAERVSEVWQQVNYRLMAIASKGRVYCHPAVRDALMSAIGPEGIRHSLERMLAK